MRRRAQVFYSGRVQGVGFRYSTREIACGYEVAGFVRNLADGRVELVAEGEEAEVQDFLEGIAASQLGSHVRHADSNWSNATGEYKGFVVQH